MTTFVLVHGSWGGGWEWRMVSDRLGARGHDAFRPTLTGLGDRAHLLGPGVDLDTHIEDVTSLLEIEDLREIVLVGHSYGGAVVTGVVDRIPERIAQVVYVDAFVPLDGESVADLLPTDWIADVIEPARARGDGRVPCPVLDDYDSLEPGLAQWYASRLGDHPLATLTQPISLRGRADGIPRAFIHLVDGQGAEPHDPFARFADRARAEGWTYRRTVGAHDIHVTDPDRITDALVDLAGG